MNKNQRGQSGLEYVLVALIAVSILIVGLALFGSFQGRNFEVVSATYDVSLMQGICQLNDTTQIKHEWIPDNGMQADGRTPVCTIK
jgi:Flp pilus assembly pilin Flp